jgi:hypothetical protein
MTPSSTVTAGTNHSLDGLSSILSYTNPTAHLIVSTALVVHTAAVATLRPHRHSLVDY